MSEELQLWPRSMVRWRCRRGVKELDIFFLGFFDRSYDQLTESHQRCFQNLLLEHDTWLQSCLVFGNISTDLDTDTQYLFRAMRQYQNDFRSFPVQE